MTELPFCFINLSTKWMLVCWTARRKTVIEWFSATLSGAKPYAQQKRKKDQIGQGEQFKILFLPLWQLPRDLPVGNKRCDQSAKTSNVGTVFFAVGFSMMMVLDVALG